jgi:uncharacterized protein (TIGR02001 family)
MKMNKIMIGTAATAMLFCGGVSANEVEANIALSTDYVFRGFSQTDENPAISGGFDYAFDSGFYLGTWASNVDFDDYDTSTEIDLYVGYAFDLTDFISLDLSAVQFIYPDETDSLNYEEYIASLGFGDASVGVVYSPDYLNSGTDAAILNAGYSFALAEGISLDFGIGYTKVDDETDLDFDGKDDYMDYSVGLTVPFAGVDLSLVGYGTDVSDEKLADDRVVFSIAKSF